jgi:hypothetical protein
MGFLDKVKGASRGVMTAAKPEDGVPAASAEEVARRLLAISGKGIQTARQDGEIVISWSARVSSAGLGGAAGKYLYRAIRVELDPSDHTASGICFKTDADAEIDSDGIAISKGWERGQHVGSETLHVTAWLGPHSTEGGADEKGYKFSWPELREPVMDAVTDAGWTYKPKKI